jgi:hypothetical protein
MPQPPALLPGQGRARKASPASCAFGRCGVSSGKEVDGAHFPVGPATGDPSEGARKMTKPQADLAIRTDFIQPPRAKCGHLYAETVRYVPCLVGRRAEGRPSQSDRRCCSRNRRRSAFRLQPKHPAKLPITHKFRSDHGAEGDVSETQQPALYDPCCRAEGPRQPPSHDAVLVICDAAQEGFVPLAIQGFYEVRGERCNRRVACSSPAQASLMPRLPTGFKQWQVSFDRQVTILPCLSPDRHSTGIPVALYFGSSESSSSACFFSAKDRLSARSERKTLRASAVFPAAFNAWAR